MKTGFASISRCRTKDDGDTDEAEGSTRISAGKEEKICSGYAGKTLLLNKALSGLSPVKFRVLHKKSSENSFKETKFSRENQIEYGDAGR